ncbi:hypothetical protein GDO86_009053 [Hymenochirus boettgeri]|uniref:Denticleless protein homolog n=1 Tax=Hymenochirus boettgeri TaxID=247094 RepID=A0A8T2JMA7_9PIPI|nr:hypothetical protein GDO86_009053 [Hymenochirus boettgeri]
MLFHSVVNKRPLGWRQTGSTSYPLQNLLNYFQCAKHDEHLSYGEMGMPVPPFGCTFSTVKDLSQVLAVANEEGIVRMYDTECRDPQRQVVKEFLAHSNAVFDVAWVPAEHKLVTASGDQTAKLWDVKAGELIGICKGHQCSLKSVAFSKFEKAVFCTGGRDGNIMVWDTRCNKKDGFYRHVNQITGAHNVLDKQTPSKIKKRKPPVKGLAPSVDSQQSVTVVIFQDEHTILSAGAVDGVVKMWDLRKNYSTYRQDPMPAKCFPYPGNSTRKLGYSSLVMDPTGTNLFASCTDDNIYMFNATGLKTEPVSVFSGHQNSTFYVKASVSPDGQFLLSGSSDHNAYIWQVSNPQAAPVNLTGHCQEVTSVAWSQSDFTKIATCSDDNTVRVWRIKRSYMVPEDTTELVGWARTNKIELQTVAAIPFTPNKLPKIQNGSLVSSPTPAMCAPVCNGDLPMPSSTPVSALMPVSRLHTPARPHTESLAASPKQMSSSKISIKDWVTRTPKSSSSDLDAKTPSPRKAFTPVEQYPPVSNSRVPVTFEKRAKRRLETSSEDMEHVCMDSCDCVMELEPGTKKAKLDLCSFTWKESSDGNCLSLADLSKGDQNQKLTSSPSVSDRFDAKDSSSQYPLSDALDKENSSPGKNWLSALGHKFKSDKHCTPSKGSSSPSARNGSAKKHPSKNISSSPVSAPPTTPGTMRNICTYFYKK